MYKSIITLIVISVLAIACNSSNPDTAADRKNGYTPAAPKTKEDSLYNDVMDGHNIAMGKMGKLMHYKIDVQHALDSVSKFPPIKQDAMVYKASLYNLQKELVAAEGAMNTWMDEFREDSAKGNTDARIKYLESEKGKVTTIKNQLLSSLQLADSLLNKH